MGKIKKKGIITGLLAIVLVIIVLGVGKSFASNDGVFKTQKIDGLSFENAEIQYDNKLSTFTVDVYNENKKEYNMKSIDIILKNQEKDTITLNYVIDNLKADEGRKIIIDKIDYDLSSYTKIKYRINK